MTVSVCVLNNETACTLIVLSEPALHAPIATACMFCSVNHLLRVLVATGMFFARYTIYSVFLLLLACFARYTIYSVFLLLLACFGR